MSIASLTSCCSGGVRNPAPHRGFNTKARNILLDSPKQRGKISRAGSDEEFLRRVNAQRLNRTDSEATSASQKSHDSAINGGDYDRFENESVGLDFDCIDREPRVKRILQHQCNPMTAALRRARPLMGELGKTKSAGELVRRIAASASNGIISGSDKIFQQMNILKMPSVDLEEPYHECTSACCRSLSNGVDYGNAETDTDDEDQKGSSSGNGIAGSHRQYRYEMKS